MKATAKNRGTVLIVDGDPAVLVLIQRILVAADHHVLLAAERADAIHIARQKHIRIDLVLMDERIPGVSGTDLADEIAALRPGVRMLWMSGFVDDGFIRIRLFDGHAGLMSQKLISRRTPAGGATSHRRSASWQKGEVSPRKDTDGRSEGLKEAGVMRQKLVR